MNAETFFYYSCYEAGLWAAKRWPWLLFAPGYKSIMDALRPFWEAWKVQYTLEEVDRQAVTLVEQWENEEREVIADQLASKAQELFPEATITPLPHAIVPSVMIVHEAAEGSSDAVKALGGELRITWRLE
jgi:hypothetical protein